MVNGNLGENFCPLKGTDIHKCFIWSDFLNLNTKSNKEELDDITVCALLVIIQNDEHRECIKKLYVRN
jgi:hypothetical protein